MDAQIPVRTYGDNQVFRFIKGIRLHRQSRQIRFFSRKRPALLYTCATCSELPSYISTMVRMGFQGQLIYRPNYNIVKQTFSDENCKNVNHFKASYNWGFLLFMCVELQRKIFFLQPKCIRKENRTFSIRNKF